MTIQMIPIEDGWLESDAAIFFEDASGRQRLPVSSWLIQHPQGNVLFDAGMHADLCHSTSRLGALADIFTIDMKLPIEDVIAGKGIDPAEIGYLVLSHLHFDHCGGTAGISNARLIVQREEWQAGHHPSLVEAGVYFPDDFDVGHDVFQIEGEHDIFGDSTVVCLPTPGHTIGHQSLKVELASGPVVLTADCVYWESLLDDLTVPSFGYDLDQQRHSMKMLQTMRTNGAGLIFGHDHKQWAQLCDAALE